jgi:hypothetical protein
MDSKEVDIFLYEDFFVSTACRTFFQQILGKGRSRNSPILFFNLWFSKNIMMLLWLFFAEWISKNSGFNVLFTSVHIMKLQVNHSAGVFRTLFWIRGDCTSLPSLLIPKFQISLGARQMGRLGFYAWRSLRSNRSLICEPSDRFCVR